ncbi:cation transporter, partial [Acinetobacter schindleri]
TAHLVAPNSNTDQLYQKALEVLKHNHNITEITLQIESKECNTLEQHKH